MVNDIFQALWGCREIVLDGEAEYGCEFLVKASDFEEADKKAWEFVKRNWVIDNDENDPPYTDFINEDGWIEIDGSERAVQVEACRQIHNLAELLDFIPKDRDVPRLALN